MKKIIIGITVLILISVLMFIYVKLSFPKKEVKESIIIKEVINNNKEVEEHYNTYVVTNKEAILYEMENNKYKIIGKVNKNIVLELESISEDKRYFKIKNLNYYIYYNNVEKRNKIDRNDRYKKYVPFNQNVLTEEKTTFYNKNGYVYEINKGINLPIIIKEKDKYYVDYNDELLYVKKEEVKLKNNNRKEKTRNNIRTFTYHAVYKEGETCKNKAICHPYNQFDSHMKYLADNNYLTLTMEELEMFLDKKINIPIKTVVITLDDGNLAKNAIEILEKYKLNATYFVITGRYDAYKIKSEYVNFESHTDNLHNNYRCPKGEQGGQLLCEKEEIILKDLELSKQKLGGSKYFSYPFFDYNDRAIKLLKQSGFHLAFLGQLNTEGYSDYSTNRYMLRRKTIFANDSLETFKSYLK